MVTDTAGSVGVDDYQVRGDVPASRIDVGIGKDTG
jgi:hypothetical protein